MLREHITRAARQNLTGQVDEHISRCSLIKFLIPDSTHGVLVLFGKVLVAGGGLQGWLL